MFGPDRCTPAAGHAFAFATCAEPAAVWGALTGGGCFPGLRLESDWRAGSALVVRAGSGGPAATVGGTVLFAAPPSRLSYWFRSGPGDPCTYLTWEIRAIARGSVVRLRVDEVDCPDDEASAEDIWLPLLAALQLGLPTV